MADERGRLVAPFGLILALAVGSAVSSQAAQRFPRSRAGMSSRDLWDFRRSQGERQKERAVSLQASSLGRSGAVTLAERLQDVLPGGFEVIDKAQEGTFLGDQLAGALADGDSTLHLVEINFFTFNERRHLYGPDDPNTISLTWQNVAALAQEGDGWLRGRLLTQHGVEGLLRSELRARWLPFFWGSAQKEHLRGFLQGHVLTRRPYREEWDFDAFAQRRLRENLAHKDFRRGLDSRLLDSWEGWVRAHPSRARSMVFYFPPLDLDRIEAASVDQPQVLQEFGRFRTELTARFAPLGVTTIDLTESLAFRPELFKDYGHQTSEGLGLTAKLLVDQLLETHHL